LVIRVAGPEDHPACAAVFLAAYRQAFPLHQPEYYVPERYFESITGEEQWVAIQNGRIIAVLSIYWPENFIHSLYVEPSIQNQGIGRRLLEDVAARAKGVCELKCDKVPGSGCGNSEIFRPRVAGSNLLVRVGFVG